MNLIDIKKSIDQHGHQLSGAEVITTCPSCAHVNQKFYLNKDSGLYHCKHCGLSGRVDLRDPETEETNMHEDSLSNTLSAAQQPAGEVQYMQHVPPLMDENVFCDEYINKCATALRESKTGRYVALTYLKRRGITDEVIAQFRLGYDEFKHSIVIPHLSNGKVFNVKYRSLHDNNMQRYFRAKGGKTILFEPPLLQDAPPVCVLTEGEMDTISSYILSPRIPSKGTGGKDIFLKGWIKKLQAFERVYIAFDNDDESDESAIKVAELLGKHRCYRVKLPPGVHDVNELLVKSGKLAPKVWAKCLEDSPCIGKPLIRNTDSYITEALEHYKRDAFRAYSTGHRKLDQITGGIQPGRLYVIAGAPKQGKTTLTTEVVMNIAMSGVKTLVGPFEMKVAQEMLPRMVSKLLGQNIETEWGKIPLGTYKKIITWISEFGNIQWINRMGAVPLNDLRECVAKAYEEGVRLLVLDHLQILMGAGGGDFQETVKVSRYVKGLTNEFPELAVIGINEFSKKKQGQGEYNETNLMGGNSIAYDADQVWIIDSGKIMVPASRGCGVAKGGSAEINFDFNTHKYTFF